MSNEKDRVENQTILLVKNKSVFSRWKYLQIICIRTFEFKIYE